jgi:hypothetical protein
MTGVLMQLATSGDSWVKLLIVGGMIANIFLTKGNGDKIREEAANNIKAIYQNQKGFKAYAKQARHDHAIMMDKLGLPASTPEPDPEEE